MNAVTPGLNGTAVALVHVVYRMASEWLLVGVEVVRKVDRVAPLLHSLLCPLSLSRTPVYHSSRSNLFASSSYYSCFSTMSSFGK
jgi:hypothetical protein